MRIVSLLPSATEILFALGLGDDVVGVTHECDYPPEAHSKPRVTSTALSGHATSSSAIDAGISRLLDEGESIYHLDVDLLEQLRPDLVFTQQLCDVCAVAYAEVNQAAQGISSRPQVINLEPATLAQVLESVIEVGRVTGHLNPALEFRHELQSRIDAVRERYGRAKPRPKVYCMEWIDPPMRTGHWVPEMVRLAGGDEGLGKPGQPSTKTTWEAVLDYRPDIIVLMPCGFDLARTLKEVAVVQDYSGWKQLPAVQSGQVWAVDGSAYFSRPGPRLVDGLEILASIINPRQFDGHLPSNAVARVTD